MFSRFEHMLLCKYYIKSKSMVYAGDERGYRERRSGRGGGLSGSVEGPRGVHVVCMPRL